MRGEGVSQGMWEGSDTPMHDASETSIVESPSSGTHPESIIGRGPDQLRSARGQVGGNRPLGRLADGHGSFPIPLSDHRKVVLALHVTDPQ